MRRRLLAGFVLFAVLATALLVVPIGVTLQVHEGTNTLHGLERDVDALSVLMTDALNHDDITRALQLTRLYTRSTGREVYVIADGSVILSSQPSLAPDERLLKIARRTGPNGTSGTSSAIATDEPQYYVAEDLSGVRGYTHAALVMTSPVEVANHHVHDEWRDLILYGLLMLALAICFGVVISGSLVRPLRAIGRDVEAVGHGDLEVRVDETVGPRELQALARAINATQARLIALLESQRAFVEDASHQLRTPLTSLQLHLENLQEALGEANEADVNYVLAEMNRLTRIVDSLLAMARNESKAPSLVTVDVHDVVFERAEVWRALAGEVDLDLRVDVPSSLRALAVADVLEQVLDNLLSNAFDATPRGGRVAITASHVVDHVELHVVDTGPGLGPAERELALRRFWRGRDNPSQGTGLGLAIVAQLLALSGGSIELREAPGGGLDATVTLREI